MYETNQRSKRKNGALNLNALARVLTILIFRTVLSRFPKPDLRDITVSPRWGDTAENMTVVNFAAKKKLCQEVARFLHRPLFEKTNRPI